MISRRLLRIKILQILYAYFINNDKTIEKTERELFFSIEKTYELYNYLLLLIVDLGNYADNKITITKERLIPTDDIISTKTKFVDNIILKKIIDNKKFAHSLRTSKISWSNHPDIVKQIYSTLLKSSFYIKYINNSESSFKEDKELIVKIYKNIIADSEDLYQTFEDISIYWNADIDYIIGMIIKSIKECKEEDNEDIQIFDLYKSDIDEDFTKKLFRKTVLHHENNKQLIDQYTKNWDVERIASIDILIMELAIVEITEFPLIPINVSFNEYIELAKFYSTDKSSNFINGVLDKIIKDLNKDNKVKKTGTGLI